MNKTNKLLTANFILLLIAAAIGGYLYWHHYALLNGDAGFGSFCSINKSVDCDVVNTSVYSEVLGIPIVSFALTYYFLALILCLVAIKNIYWQRENLVMLVALSGIGAVVSLIFAGIQAFVLKNYCILCLSICTIDLAVFFLSLKALCSFGALGPFSGFQKSRFALFAALGGVFFLALIIAGTQLKVDYPLDELDFLSTFRQQQIQKVDAGNSPRKGFEGDNPPIQLVEYADFQCPGCGVAARHMHRLTKLYKNKIQLVFKHFPLDSSCNPHVPMPMHPMACGAAKAAICAHKQGKFDLLFEKMFSNQKDLTQENIRSWAKDFQFDVATFEACLASNETTQELMNDMDQAYSLGLRSTPTFFVNGRKVEGMIDEKKLKLLIRELGK